MSSEPVRLVATCREDYSSMLEYLYLEGAIGMQGLLVNYCADAEADALNWPLAKRLSLVRRLAGLDFDRIVHGDALFRWLRYPIPRPEPAPDEFEDLPFYYAVPCREDHLNPEVGFAVCPDEVAEWFTVTRYGTEGKKAIVDCPEREQADLLAHSLNFCVDTLRQQGAAVSVYFAKELRGADRDEVKAAMERAGEEAILTASQAVIFRGSGV